MKNLCFFGGGFFQKKKSWHLEFSMNQIFRQKFIIFKRWRYRGQLLQKLQTVEVYFIQKRLDQLNGKHTRIAVNSAIRYFKVCSQKKCLLKVWCFLVHPPQNGNPVKLFAKLKENRLLMVNIFKCHEYQPFGLMKMHNICKFWFGNNIFSLWQSLVYD